MAHRVCTLLIAPGGKADIAPPIRSRARSPGCGTLTDPLQYGILRSVPLGLGIGCISINGNGVKY